MISRIAKYFGIFMVILAAGKAGSVLARMLLARELDRAQFGQFSIVLVVIPICATIGLLGMHKAIVREYSKLLHAKDIPSLRGLIVVPFVLALLTSLLIAVVFAGFQMGGDFELIPELSQTEILLVALAVPGYALLVYSSFLLWAAGHSRLYLFGEQTSFPLLFLSMVLALFFMGRVSLIEALVAYTISSWFVGLSLLTIALIRCRRDVDKSGDLVPRYRIPRRSFYSYSITLLFSSLAYLALGSIDRILLGQLVELEEVALYSVAYTIVALVPVILVIADAQITPKISKALAQQDFTTLEKVYVEANRYVLLLATMTCTCMVIVHAWLLGMFGEPYVGAASVFLVLIIGEYVNVLSGVSGRILQVGGQEKFEMRLAMILVAVCITLNLILIPTYGILGAAIATGAIRFFHGAIKAWRVRTAWGIGFWRHRLVT